MTGVNILFDLDGTLTDPREGITRCVRVALEALGVRVPPQSELDAFIGPPLRRSFATLLGTDDAAAVERALELYRARYRTDGMYENRVYDAVPAMLERLRESHYGTEEELREAGAGVICHSPAEIPDAVHRALATP